MFEENQPTARAAVDSTFLVRGSGSVRFARPTPDDGLAVRNLVRRAAGLDENSAYAYVLLCDEFRDTCLVARDAHDQLVGFVTGFHRPRAAETLFLWQVGVDPAHRGRGLAHALVRAFVARGRVATTRHLETTIAGGNHASMALFSSFARSIGSHLEPVGSYGSSLLGAGHPDEVRFRIRIPREAI